MSFYILPDSSVCDCCLLKTILHDYTKSKNGHKSKYRWRIPLLATDYVCAIVLSINNFSKSNIFVYLYAFFHHGFPDFEHTF